jgi:hypothetical protein
MDYLVLIDLYLLSFLLYRYYIFVCFLMLTCTVVFVLGCNWTFLAVVKHVNKRTELNYYYYYYYYFLIIGKITQIFMWKQFLRNTSTHVDRPMKD